MVILEYDDFDHIVACSIKKIKIEEMDSEAEVRAREFIKEIDRRMIDRCTASGIMPGRNDPCPCGSGKKYKKCCMNRT